MTREILADLEEASVERSISAARTVSYQPIARCAAMKPETTADAEVLAKEITDKAFSWLRDHHGEAVSPALIRQSTLAVMAEYKERDLEEGVDYRIEAEGARVTITPVSPRGIEWFARCQSAARLMRSNWSWDCAIEIGCLHVPGCDIKRCPMCGCQMIKL